MIEPTDKPKRNLNVREFYTCVNELNTCEQSRGQTLCMAASNTLLIAFVVKERENISDIITRGNMKHEKRLL